MLIKSIVRFVFHIGAPLGLGTFSPKNYTPCPSESSFCQHLGQRGLEAETVESSGPGFRWRDQLQFRERLTAYRTRIFFDFFIPLKVLSSCLSYPVLMVRAFLQMKEKGGSKKIPDPMN